MLHTSPLGEGLAVSRWTRALGFGDGDGDNRARTSADSPKVRRIRESMRWRGYDLSEYSDEQIAAVSARFPNDISEDGEATEDGRRALAAGLERGDFASPPPPPVAPEPPSREPAATSATPPRQPPPPSPAAPSSAHRASLGMPSLPERLAHIVGLHAWRPLGDGDGRRMQCAGCGQMRNEPIPFRAPPPPPPARPPARPTQPPPEEPSTRREAPSRSPLDDLSNLEDRERTGVPPQRPQPGPARQRGDGPWAFFMGLPWWSKLLAIFILIQVVGFIVSAIAGGGGGGGGGG